MCKNNFTLTKDLTDQIDQWISKFPRDRKRSAIIATLSILQEYNNGWLSKELIMASSDYLDVPVAEVYEIASFYSNFRLHPVGKNKISVCTNLCCMLNGCRSIINYISKKLDLEINQNSKDGKFTLEEMGCISCCDGSPVIMINNKKIYNVTIEKISQILENLK